MILVKRNPEDPSQKAVSSFTRRVRKFGLVPRKRKTQYRVKALSSLQKKRKAVRMADYLAKQIIVDRVGRK
ncbi:MAG: hypothetical protein AAGF07_04485 [Patescibacteria group bacterium]